MHCRRETRYDFIAVGGGFIAVGGGSAGSALANRLSTNPSNRMLVLRPARLHLGDLHRTPAALPYRSGTRLYDWCCKSEPEPHVHGRQNLSHPRQGARRLQQYQRDDLPARQPALEPSAADLGMKTWDYAHCFPYFKKMENCLAGGDEFHGDRGPLILERGPATNPLFQAFF
jgi:choline dehydrogenase